MIYTGEDRIDRFFAHHGIKGQKWGIRRYQYDDGTLTPEGRKRYSYGSERDYKEDKLTRKARKDDDKTIKALQKTYRSLNKIHKIADKKGELKANKYYNKAGNELRKMLDAYIEKHGTIRLDDILKTASSKETPKNPEHNKYNDEITKFVSNAIREKHDAYLDDAYRYQFFGPSTWSQEKYKQGIEEARKVTADKQFQAILSDNYKNPPQKAVDNFFKGIKTKSQLDKKISNLDTETLFDNSYTSSKKERELENKIRNVKDDFLRDALINQRMNYDPLELTDEIYKRASELRKTLKD